MNDSEKPFACNNRGCNMSFVNEDHLTVHKRKHDMILNLGVNNKTNFLIVDQTPTPTRFIRSCDDVGLFQDLHNENPFDDTFRRAVETGKSEVLTGLEVDEIDNTLQTPNLVLEISNECKTSVDLVPIRNQIKKLDTKSSIKKATIIQTVSSKKTAPEDCTKNNQETCKIYNNSPTNESINAKTTTADFSLDNQISKIESHTPVFGEEIQFITKAHDTKLLKYATPIIVNGKVNAGNSETEDQSLIKEKSVPHLCSRSNKKVLRNQKISIAKLKLKQALIMNGVVNDKKPAENSDHENKTIETLKQKERYSLDYKKQALLERNRASSMRARAKRKAWIEQLQQSLKVANETNSSLHMQLEALHAQVAKLKTLLLAHKDCPVTKAMEKGNGIIVGSNVITIKPNEIKYIPVNTGSSKSIKRTGSDKLIIPKKNPIMLSTAKDSINLPKNEACVDTITLHASEIIKSIPAISFTVPNVNDNRKTVLNFLHINSDKLPFMQNAYSVAENFKTNAASETTGT